MTVNERIASETIGHQIDLQHYSNGVVRRMIALLNRVDVDLAAQIMAALERMDPASFTVERLESLLASARSLNASAYQAVERELTAELRVFVATEAQFQTQLFEAAIPAPIRARVPVFAVHPEQVYTAALARPFQGRLLREWAASIEEGRMARIRDAIRIGYVENQSLGEIIRRIRGTRAAGYADGIMNMDRHHAESIVRTAIMHMAAVTRERFQAENADIIKAVQWLAILDHKTSVPCRLRDKLQYTVETPHRPIGHSVPWLAGPGMLHIRCRSTATSVLKSMEELGIDDGFDFKPETRAAMDGKVPADTTYAMWIKAQSAARQDEILGPSRGKLMREGGLDLDRFYNDRGRYLNLAELRARNAAAFERAGL